MKLVNYLEKDHIFISDSCEDTTSFYDAFCHFLKERGIIEDARAVKRLFLKRESVQSTGIGKGAATPHIFAKEFSRFYVFAALVRQGVDFKAPDGMPVSLIFPIVSDDRDVGLHLKSLAHIARLVLNTDIVAATKASQTPAELYETLIAAEKKI